MTVRLLHTKQCHLWKAALDELEAALGEAGLPRRFEVGLIESDEEAVRERFLGSPTIQIEGQDIDPTAPKEGPFQASGCRGYLWEGKFVEVPPRPMIVAALKRASGKESGHAG